MWRPAYRSGTTDHVRLDGIFLINDRGKIFYVTAPTLKIAAEFLRCPRIVTKQCTEAAEYSGCSAERGAGFGERRRRVAN